MKKLTLRTLLMTAAGALLMACSPKSDTVTAPVVEEVAFGEAHNYFVRNDVDSIPTKILTAEEFAQYFGSATTMAPDGKPTQIDFDKDFVIAVTMGETNTSVEFEANSLTLSDKTLTLDVGQQRGKPLSYTMRPLMLLTVDRAFADYPVVVQKD